MMECNDIDHRQLAQVPINLWAARPGEIGIIILVVCGIVLSSLLLLALVGINAKLYLGTKTDLPATITVTATAYAPTGKPTALGTKARPGGTLAVNRKHLAWLGKQVYILGLGIFKVTDLMAEDAEAEIDIFMATAKDAKLFGRQTLKLVVLPGCR